MRYRTGTAAVMAAVLAGGGCATMSGPEEVLPLPYVKPFSESPLDADLPEGWRLWNLSRLKQPTRYKLIEQDGRKVVKASADASASGLVHPLRLDPRTYRLLSWEWKIGALIAGADNTRKASEDSPVRIVVTFDGDSNSLPLEERIFADNFRLLTGQDLPYATLMYIWENRAAPDSIIPSRHTSRIKMIVARSGPDGLGTWHKLDRNLYADFRRAFGEEPGTITAVAIMTDTDNTGEKAAAYYGDIVFRRIAPPRVVLESD